MLTFKIFSIVFFRFSAVKGGDPVSISYIRAPRDHQSTALPCPLLVKISGAMYSIVPQKLIKQGTIEFSFDLKISKCAKIKHVLAQ